MIEEVRFLVGVQRNMLANLSSSLGSKLFCALVMLLFQSGCGSNEVLSQQESETTGTSSLVSDTVAAQKDWTKHVKVSVSVKQVASDYQTPYVDRENAFALVEEPTANPSVSLMTIKVAACASGFLDTEMELSASNEFAVRLYRNDSNCRLQLQDFILDGVRYREDPEATAEGEKFDTWMSGDLSKFYVYDPDSKTYDREKMMEVIVERQLPKILIGDVGVSYVFRSAEKRVAEMKIETTSSVPLKISGQKSPDVQLKTAELSGVDAAGIGSFSFLISCNQTLVEELCLGQDPKKMTVALIEDVDADGTLSLAEADAIKDWFPKVNLDGVEATNISILDSTELLKVAGPGKLDQKGNESMIFVVRYLGAYSYFPVTYTRLD